MSEITKKKYPHLTPEQRIKYRERITQFMSKYYENNKEHLKNEAKRYYEENKEKVINRTRKNYLDKKSSNTLSHLPFFNIRVHNISKII